MQIGPIAPKRIYQSIIEQFVTLLKEDKIKIGQRLPSERDLAERFRVSRPSVREALRAMEIIGLIEIRQGDGVFVTGFNLAPFLNTISPLLTNRKDFELELIELRRMLELHAAELASDNITGAKTRLLRKPLEKMKKALDDSDAELGSEADIEFHETIFEVTDNFVLKKASECVVTVLEMSVKFARSLMLVEPDTSETLYGQHVGIFEAISQGNREQARKRMDEHLGYVVDFYKKKKKRGSRPARRSR